MLHLRKRAPGKLRYLSESDRTAPTKNLSAQSIYKLPFTAVGWLPSPAKRGNLAAALLSTSPLLTLRNVHAGAPVPPIKNGGLLNLQATVAGVPRACEQMALRIR